jgi:hypothetical protein
VRRHAMRLTLLGVLMVLAVSEPGAVSATAGARDDCHDAYDEGRISEEQMFTCLRTADEKHVRR